MPSNTFWGELADVNVADLDLLFLRLSQRFQSDQALLRSAFDKIFKAERTESEPEPIEFLRAGVFLEKVGRPPDMLVQMLLPQKSLFLLSGKPKHCKSFMALDIADCVCRGLDVFETYTTNKPGPVVYLAMEDGDYEVANRLLQRGIRPGDTRDLIICTARFTLSTQEALGALRGQIEALNPTLVIVDTAAEALGIKDWSNRGEITDKMRPLRDFAREICTVLLVTHSRKAEGNNGDEIAGSNAFTGAVDGWLSIYAKQILANGNVQLFLRAEGRGGVRGEFAVEMDTHTLGMKTLTPEEIAEAKQAEKAQETEKTRAGLYRRVGLAVQEQSGRATIAQISTYLEMEYKPCWSVVQEMVKVGHLVDSGDRRKAEGRGKEAVIYAVSKDYLLILNSTYPYRTEEEETETNPPSAPLHGNVDLLLGRSKLPYKDDDDEEEAGWK